MVNDPPRPPFPVPPWVRRYGLWIAFAGVTLFFLEGCGVPADRHRTHAKENAAAAAVRKP